MNIQKALELFRLHQQTTIKSRTIASYRKLLEQLEARFSEHNLESISSEEICQFLELLTRGSAKSTRHPRYAQLKAVFNFIESYDLNIKNPCNAPVLFKSYKSYSKKTTKNSG